MKYSNPEKKNNSDKFSRIYVVYAGGKSFNYEAGELNLHTKKWSAQ